MLEKLWYQKKIKWYQFGLVPFTYLYQLIISIKSLVYNLQLKKTTQFDVPVIVVGNITVGGTGKTPIVIALAHWLRQQGYTPGIVSRGYKGKAKQWPQVVSHSSQVETVGDEPYLLFKNAECPVVVSPNRVDAVKTLLAKFNCDVVLSDDGLQHLALGRRVEIAVVDPVRKVGNGRLLPAGPLREKVERLKRVDFILGNGLDYSTPSYLVGVEPGQLVQVNDPARVVPKEALSGKKIHAVAGIANPERFFKMLRSMGLSFTPHAFRDHHAFTQADFSFLQSGEYVLLTEKDAVKCKRFANDHYLYIPIKANLPAAFLNQLISKIHP